MNTPLPPRHGAAVVPCLRYRDAPAAIEWLCRAFGFQRHLVVPAPDGNIAHAQRVRDSAMIMLSSAVDDTFGRLMRQPADIGGGQTQCPYLIVQDADALYAQARAAGADIVFELADADYGGRGFTCRDPEGHVWNFGTYDPWS